MKWRLSTVSNTEDTKQESIVIVCLFVIFTIAFLIAGFSGYAWEILTRMYFSFNLVILSIILAVTAGAVMTYSFVSFSQNHEVRHLMFLVMSANIVVWIVLFLLSHPSSSDWSTYFSDYNRNRTLAMTFVMVVIPTIILGSFTGEMKPSRPSVLLLIVWGGLIMPIVSLVLFLSPNALFNMVTAEGEGGIQGLTPVGAALSMGYILSQIIALPRMVQVWRREKTSTNLALMIALALWIIGTVFIIVLWNPLQIAELLWIASITTGFFIIAVALFMTSIIHPHRFLEQQVLQRTKELNQSMLESEFYLRMWTHKMGNLLQGMITYLDILEYVEQHSEDDTKTRSAARGLSQEASIVNLQVNQLTRIKEQLDKPLYPVRVLPSIVKGIEANNELIGNKKFSMETNLPEDISVTADGFLPLVFQSLFSFHAHHCKEENINFRIISDSTNDQCIISITGIGEPIPEEYKQFMMGSQDLNSIALSLDLFTVNLLLTRYHATIDCVCDQTKPENTYILTFPEN